MLIIRIKSRCFLKPRFCPDCRKFCLFIDHPRGCRCKECHKKHRRLVRITRKRTQKMLGTYKYNNDYLRKRKKLIANHPYCALCGQCENLTVHHVGGVNNGLYTVLCDECHQAYEKYKNQAQHIRKLDREVRKLKSILYVTNLTLKLRDKNEIPNV